MKILHTSDWHLGQTLYGRKRYEEFASFLMWLSDYISQEKVDILLICGDIFDTTTPSNKAQELYYQFLAGLSNSSCKHIVIIAGNHDSPTFLEAPKRLLEFLHIHVIGIAETDINTENRQDNSYKEILLLEENGVPQCILCAVPYLREKDIRLADIESFAEESEDTKKREKNQKIMLSIKNHYATLAKEAQKQQSILFEQRGKDVPIIALGHLFAAGAMTHSQTEDDVESLAVTGEGVRDLYVGSLVHVGADIFSDYFDYVALGHLHIPQKINKNEYIRYCGSPLPMGFGEANHIKKLCLLTIDENDKNIKSIEEIPIPTFQKMIKISGDIEIIFTEIAKVKEYSPKAWLEIEYTGKNIIPNLREVLDEKIEESALEILRVRNNILLNQTLRNREDSIFQEDLSDLSLEDVFEKCLDAHGVEEEKRLELRQSYFEILQDLQDNDTCAE